MSRARVPQGNYVLWFSMALIVYYLIAAVFFQDIALHDESTFYLSQKDRLSPSSFLVGAEYGPLYAAWYRLLAVLVRDNMALYFVSWGLLVVAAVELMRRATKATNSIFPLLITLGLPIFKVSPYVGLFASVVILAGFIAAKSRASANGAMVAISVSGIVAGLVRPEFLYAPAIMLIGYIAYALVSRRFCMKTMLICTAIAVLAIFISRSSDTGRGAVAFEQHYNLRASERGEIGSESPWTSRHARAFFFQNDDRGIKYQLSDYVKAKPAAVLAHVARNMTDPRTILFGLACAAIAFFLYRAGQIFAAMYVTVMSLPPLISCSLIYPRNHYIVTVLLVLVAGASLAAGQYLSGNERFKRFRTPALLLLGLAVFVFSLNIGALRHPPKSFATQRLAALHPVVSTILEIRALEQKQPEGHDLVIFEPYGGINIYLKRKWTWVAEYNVKSKEQLLEMIQNHRAKVFLTNADVSSYLKVSVEELDQAFKLGGYQSRPCTYLDCKVHVAPG